MTATAPAQSRPGPELANPAPSRLLGVERPNLRDEPRPDSRRRGQATTRRLLARAAPLAVAVGAVITTTGATGAPVAAAAHAAAAHAAALGSDPVDQKPATSADDSTPASSAPATSINEFVPDDVNVSECISALPRPGCGSEERAGWRQTLLLGVLVAGLAVIGWRIVVAVRRGDQNQGPS